MMDDLVHPSTMELNPPPSDPDAAWRAIVEELDAYEGDEEMLMLEPRSQFDPCVVGVVRRFHDTFVLYSYSKVIESLAAGMDQDDDDDDPYTVAREHFEFNVIGGWVGDGTPAFLMDGGEF